MRWRGLAVALIAGCYNPTIRPGAPCATDAECPSTLSCVAGVCGGTDVDVDAAVNETDGPMLDAPPDALVTVNHVFGDDADELRDAELWGGDNAALNFGTGDHFSVDGAESGVLWFDLTSIPAGTTVVTASLTLHVADAADEGGGTLTIHRLREAWVETEVTWLSRATGQAWGVSGARSPSSDAAAFATFSPAAVNTDYTVSLPITMVQEWVDNAAINYGVVIVRGTSLEHVHIGARESAARSSLSIDVY